MKTLRMLTLSILMLVLSLFSLKYYINRSTNAGTPQIVNFYNWGDYIEPSLLKQFEEETGYTVIYETFDSNEAMLTKLQQGGTQYDLIVPSEYMVEVMIEADLLQPLDHSKLTQLDQYSERFMNMPFDPGNQYSLPYFWGTLGIVYNQAQLGEAAIDDWDDLWDGAYHGQILMIDGAREVLGIGLQSLGYSLNETDDKKLEQAADKMKSLMPNISALITDEIKMHLVNGEAPIGITFSGEAMMAMEEHDDLVYVVPESGSNIWTDNFAIPKNADNPDGAHALIDFLSRPEIVAQNVDYIGYATPVETAFKYLDPELFEDDAFLPDQEIIDRLEVYRNLGQERLIRYNDLYLEVKIAPKY